MKMNALTLLVFSVGSILLAACGTLEVGIETISPPTPFPSDVPKEGSIIPTESVPTSAEIIPTETPPPAVTIAPDVPELVSIGHLAPFAGPDIGVLTLKDGQLSLEPGPVYYEILWDYSPVSGRLAYSSEFFHGSESNNISVSDLWVYDYQSGNSEKWLGDNVARASWAPDGERVTAAIYNPESEQIGLVLVSGPDQVELIADCASMLYS